MNVRAAWAAGHRGKNAVVRHLDFGVYSKHEDLKGNINIVHSRSETEDCNHGTASTGCIAAIYDEKGVTGIAHYCDFYFYDTGDLDKIVLDVEPGDIVSLDIQFGISGDNLVPVTHSKSWWDKIAACVDAGAVVILAAGNGGLDLKENAENGLFQDWGDSGSTLIGASYHTSGKRVGFSNFNHSTSLLHSWGDWSVATTGYGSLQRKPGNDKNYSKDYSGTSSATPLVSGALAVIQSYAKNVYGMVLDSYDMRELIKKTGFRENTQQGIGWRPDVMAAIKYLENFFDAVVAVIEGPDEASVGDIVDLSGGKSSSSMGAIVTYAWDIPDSVNADSQDAVKLRFTVPKVTEDLVFKLTVTDEKGTSAHTEHTVRIKQSTQYDPWKRDKAYPMGNRVSYNNSNWESRWWIQGVEPGNPQVPGGDAYPWQKLV